MKRLHLTPAVSITLGLVSITILIFFILDRVIGIIPNADEQLREIRETTSINLSLQLSALLHPDDIDLLNRTLVSIQDRNVDIQSVAVRLNDGTLMAQSGSHNQFWVTPPGKKSTLNHIQIPIYQKLKDWGKIEISYRAATENSIKNIVTSPSVALPATIFLLGSFLYYIYLRRVLNHLDPTQVIPDRVNNALDTLTEGVMIIDKNETILLTNKNFKTLHPDATVSAIGKKVTSLKWLLPAIEKSDSEPPWKQVLKTEKSINHVLLNITQPDSKERIVSMNVAPVKGGESKVQGCLVTFNDITQKERINTQLRKTLTKLQLSQSKIKAQNKELQTLANFDQLTGIFNRRAFFEHGEKQLKLCTQTNMPLSCIMCDIDHFKVINDNHGHPVGDSAIQVVTSLLSRNIRQNDVLGRYGGEEFCIVLPGISEEKSIEIAERMRDSIEKLAGKGVRSVEGLRITSSFGVSILTSKNQSLPDLIELADQALYTSKDSGRNKVSVYRETEERKMDKAQL